MALFHFSSKYGLIKSLPLLILLLLCLYSSAQQPPPPVNKKPLRSNITKYTKEKRLLFYPFNSSSQIAIISFGIQKDSTDPKSHEKLKPSILNDTARFSTPDQLIILKSKQIDTLTDILYNECNRWNSTEYSEAGCYNPHNAILFFDKKGSMFEYIEICFECSKVVLSNTTLASPDVCDKMYTAIETFFKRNGLKTNTKRQ